MYWKVPKISNENDKGGTIALTYAQNLQSYINNIDQN